MKRGQVNIDLIVSALLFTSFLVVMFSMIMDTTNPFLTVVSQDIQEKERTVLVSEVPETFESFKELCHKETESFKDLGFAYSISLIPLPGWDKRSSKGALSIRRKDYRIVLNTSESFNITLKFPESVINMSKNVNATRDYYGNWVYELELGDEVVRINSGNQNWFLISGMSNKSVFLGQVPLEDSCGTGTRASSIYEFNTIFKSPTGRLPTDLKVRVYE